MSRFDVAPPNPRGRAAIRSGGDPGTIADAAARLRGGEPVAFPTETVYGLGADAFDPAAVARIFAIKDRPSFDPLIVHVAAPTELERLATDAALVDPRVATLVERFWPGPLTLVLSKRDVVPGIVTAGLPTVGIRMPDHPLALALIREAGVPIAAPSANRFGGISPTRAEHVAAQLGGRVGLIVDGGRCRVGVESSVLQLGDGPPILLRPGGIPLEAIEALIGRVEIASAALGRSASPGRSSAHYAPSTPVVLAAPEATPTADGRRLGLLAATEEDRVAAQAVGGPFAAVDVLSPSGDLVEAAARLFDVLHDLDAAGLDEIVAQPVPEDGLGRAIMDRLRRASAATMAP